MEASFVGTKKPQVLSKPGLVCEQTTFRSSLETKKKTSCASTFRTIDHLVTPISPLKHGGALWMMKTEDD